MITADRIAPRLAALTLVVLLSVTGCNDDQEGPLRPPVDADIPDSSLPFPDTPDQVMANFRTIYEAMDVGEYKLILDPAFKTLLQPGTINEFPLVGEELDVAEENRIHTRMFSGQALEDPSGGFIPPVLNFSFDRFGKIVDWGVSLGTDPIPNTLSAMYQVDILVDRGQQFSTLKVRGQIRFYVTIAEGRLNGQPRDYYRLVGQLDITDPGKDVGGITWGSLKALFF